MTHQQEQLQQLYEAYIEQAEAAEARKKFGDGFFGLGTKAADDPCHERFVADVRELLLTVTPEAMDSAALRTLLSWFFSLPAAHERLASIYWTLIAAQSAALPLIPRLEPQDAATLHEDFKRRYRSWNRLPVQEEILRLLDKAQKQRK